MENEFNTGTGIYGSHLNEMEQLVSEIDKRIENLREKITAEQGMNPIEHYLSRIKSEESMREKCRRNNLPETEESALKIIHDAIGVRIVCAFLDDVFLIRDYLKEMPDFTVVQEKDYIRNAKPNGYRSYHMILLSAKGYYVEVQLRTISMDTWAALEHHMKYKKDLNCDVSLISSELKRCADELASTDVSMQTIKNLIFENNRRTQ